MSRKLDADGAFFEVVVTEVPAFVVGRGVSAEVGAHETEPVGLHLSLHQEVADGVVKLVFHAGHAFALYGEVEYRFLTVLVGEGQSVILGLDAVGKGHAVFGDDPFVGALLALGLRYGAVFVAPAFVA